MSKLDQLRALRERQFATAVAESIPPRTKITIAGPIAPPKPAFDRVAYQREYMKRWRARQKAAALTERR